MTHPQFQWVAKLNNFRRLYPALLTGSHVNLWNDPSGPGLFAYARRLEHAGGLRRLQHRQFDADLAEPPDDLSRGHAPREPARHERDRHA